MSADRKVARELNESGLIILKEPDIEITNIVASTDLGGNIDLETPADILENAIYKLEQFPSLI